jgi:hypothetical protein
VNDCLVVVIEKLTHMSTIEQKRLKVPYGSRSRHKADALQFVMSPRPKLAPLHWRHRQKVSASSC